MCRAKDISYGPCILVILLMRDDFTVCFDIIALVFIWGIDLEDGLRLGRLKPTMMVCVVSSWWGIKPYCYFILGLSLLCSK